MKFIHFNDCKTPKVEKDITDDIVSGTPQHFSQLHYSGHGETIKSGVWECTAGVFKAVMQDQVEFCHILEGGATIKTGAGESFTVKAGDAFVMESGLELEWTVDKFVKKHFVICGTKDLPAA